MKCTHNCFKLFNPLNTPSDRLVSLFQVRVLKASKVSFIHNGTNEREQSTVKQTAAANFVLSFGHTSCLQNVHPV